MAKCRFTTKYYDYESREYIDYNCDSKDEVLDSGFCIFHDKNYFQDYLFREEKKRNVREKLMNKVNDSIANNKALFCIGYHLPDITINQANFAKPAYFLECKFQGVADFSKANFQGLADFSSATFSEQANFLKTTFSGEITNFSWLL